MSEITDEMVERALNRYHGKSALNCQWTQSLRDEMRAALTAAINPPEPEIFVSREMELAGIEAAKTKHGHEADLAPCQVARIYRAMRRMEPTKYTGPLVKPPCYWRGGIDPATGVGRVYVAADERKGQRRKGPFWPVGGRTTADRRKGG